MTATTEETGRDLAHRHPLRGMPEGAMPMVAFLSILAGFIGAAAYTHSAGYFVTFMTGNTDFDLIEDLPNDGAREESKRSPQVGTSGSSPNSQASPGQAAMFPSAASTIRQSSKLPEEQAGTNLRCECEVREPGSCLQ